MKTYSEPAFWDDVLIGNEPICNALETNFSEIKKEALRLKKFARFLFVIFTAPSFRKKFLVGKDDGWLIAPFFGNKHDLYARRRSSKLKIIYGDLLAIGVRLLCPKTLSIFRKHFREGNVFNAYFTQLAPGSAIKPHTHMNTDGFDRINLHLGIVCDPCATITVGPETKSWEEGKVLTFKTTGPWKHSVKHEGTVPRLILIVEVKVDYLKQYGVY